MRLDRGQNAELTFTNQLKGGQSEEDTTKLWQIKGESVQRTEMAKELQQIKVTKSFSSHLEETAENEMRQASMKDSPKMSDEEVCPEIF